MVIWFTNGLVISVPTTLVSALMPHAMFLSYIILGIYWSTAFFFKWVHDIIEQLDDGLFLKKKATITQL